MDLAVAQKLACNLMAEHGLMDLGPQGSWTFRFDNSRRRFGLCRYGPRRISLSKHLVALNEEAAVRNTILHEIAHAILPPGEGHGSTWVLKARSIGCDGIRCYNGEGSAHRVTRPVVVSRRGRIIGTCPNCKSEIRCTYRKNKPCACTPCCRKFNRGKFDPRFQFIWRMGNI